MVLAHNLLNYGIPDEIDRAVGIMYKPHQWARREVMSGQFSNFQQQQKSFKETPSRFLFAIVEDYTITQSFYSVQDKKPHRQRRRYLGFNIVYIYLSLIVIVILTSTAMRNSCLQLFEVMSEYL